MNNKPVAYGMLTFCKNCGEQNPYAVKELTEEEMKQIAIKHQGTWDEDTFLCVDYKSFAKAILRKAQEK